MNGIINIISLAYPTDNHKKYLSDIYNYCLERGFSLILKGSFAKGSAKRFSDIDILIIGQVLDSEVDKIINIHGNPIMTNFTENPKGIMIIVYPDTITVDLEIRNSITIKDLEECIILLKNQENFIFSTDIDRRSINSQYIPEREDWYKVLRLIHRALIKYLCGNMKVANELLFEVRDSLVLLEIYGFEFDNVFESDIKRVFVLFKSKYPISKEVIALFEEMFVQLDSGLIK